MSSVSGSGVDGMKHAQVMGGSVCNESHEQGTKGRDDAQDLSMDCGDLGPNIWR